MNEEIEESEISTHQSVQDALVYPWRDSGWIIILIGAVISAALDLIFGFGVLGLVAWFMGLAYFNAFYFNIVESTISGSDEAPDWPDLSDIPGSILLPMGRTIGVWLISFLPAILVLSLREEGSTLWENPLGVLAMLAGAFYFPMAILDVIVGNDIRLAMPQHVLPRIRRAMPRYLSLVGLLVALLILSSVVSSLTSSVPIAGIFVSSGVALYFMMAQARLAGLFYRQRMEAEAIEDAEADERAARAAHQARERIES